jgi:hypothetical protein
MKRDMDLIRNMLMDLEDGGKRAREGLDTNDKEAKAAFGYHAYLLADAGLIYATNASVDQNPLPRYVPLYLTWAGHEFLDAARDDGRWNKAKAIGVGAGGFAVSVMKELLLSLMKQQVGLP